MTAGEPAASPPLPPLFLLAGAPGAGKTSLLPHLVAALPGVVVIDMDELLEDGRLLGVPVADPSAAPIWPAYGRMWRRIVAAVRRAGVPVLLLTPVPDAVEVGEPGPWPAPVGWALLDCADDVRRRRLAPRGWPAAWVDDAVADAVAARKLIGTVFDTGEADQADVAARIRAWVGTGLAP